MVLELEIVKTGKTFTLDFFKNDLPDFLVQKHIFEHAYQSFIVQHSENNIIGKVFDTKVRSINKVKIYDVQPKEPTLYP